MSDVLYNLRAAREFAEKLRSQVKQPELKSDAMTLLFHINRAMASYVELGRGIAGEVARLEGEEDERE